MYSFESVQIRHRIPSHNIDNLPSVRLLEVIWYRGSLDSLEPSLLKKETFLQAARKSKNSSLRCSCCNNYKAYTYEYNFVEVIWDDLSGGYMHAKVIVIALVLFNLFICGCCSQTNQGGIQINPVSGDSVTGCWQTSMYGITGGVNLNADHTYYAYGANTETGTWERNGNTIQLTKYVPSQGGYVTGGTLAYNSETDSLYSNDIALRRVNCNS